MIRNRRAYQKRVVPAVLHVAHFSTPYVSVGCGLGRGVKIQGDECSGQVRCSSLPWSQQLVIVRMWFILIEFRVEHCAFVCAQVSVPKKSRDDT